MWGCPVQADLGGYAASCFLASRPCWIVASGIPNVPDGVTIYLTDQSAPTSVTNTSGGIGIYNEGGTWWGSDANWKNDLRKVALSFAPLLGPDGLHTDMPPEGISDMNTWRDAVEVVVMNLYQNVLKIDPTTGYSYASSEPFDEHWTINDIYGNPIMEMTTHHEYGRFEHILTSNSKLNRATAVVLGYLDMTMHAYVTGNIQQDTSTDTGWTAKETLARIDEFTISPCPASLDFSPTIKAELEAEGITSDMSISEEVLSERILTTEHRLQDMTDPIAQSLGVFVVVATKKAAVDPGRTALYGTDASWDHLHRIAGVWRKDDHEVEYPKEGYIDVWKATEDQPYNSSSIANFEFVVIDQSTNTEVDRQSTDANGYIHFKLRPGTYKIMEVQKDKYLSLSHPTFSQDNIVVVPQETVNVYPENYLARGGVKFTKFDADFNS